jgi:signal peptidase II
VRKSFNNESDGFYMPQRSYRVVLWTLALLGVSLDQASKYGVFHWLANVDGNRYSLFTRPDADEPSNPKGFHLVAQFTKDADGNLVPHVNQGALFGFLRGYSTMANGGFAVISLLAALAIAVWSMQPSTGRDPWLCGALGLILAGTLGNLYDRVVFSGVRDFLHWNLGFNWPVFNIADCCLVLGAALLLIQAFASSTASKTASEPSLTGAVPQPTQHS